MHAVRELAAARQVTETARAALDAPERAEAENAGWTSADLRKVGFAPPRTRPPGRPRRGPARRRNDDTPAPEPTATPQASPTD